MLELFRVVDCVVAVDRWADLRAKLPPVIDELQFWGHGSEGVVYLGGVGALADTVVQHLRGRLAKGGVLWFRTCATFGGRDGVAFARVVAALLDVKVAGHVLPIGLEQPGLHVCAPGGEPVWSSTTTDGVTVSCFATRLPAGFW